MCFVQYLLESIRRTVPGVQPSVDLSCRPVCIVIVVAKKHVPLQTARMHAVNVSTIILLLLYVCQGRTYDSVGHYALSILKYDEPARALCNNDDGVAIPSNKRSCVLDSQGGATLPFPIDCRHTKT